MRNKHYSLSFSLYHTIKICSLTGKHDGQKKKGPVSSEELDAGMDAYFTGMLYMCVCGCMYVYMYVYMYI